MEPAEVLQTVSKIYRFKSSSLSRGSPARPCCCLVTVTRVSLHTSPDHVSCSHVPARPVPACTGTLLPAATRQLAFLRLFGKELWNRFDVLLCHTRYMVSASLGQHNSWVYPNTLTPTNPSKYWFLLPITVDNIMILQSTSIWFQSWAQLIALLFHSTLFQCVPAYVCVCVWSPDLSTWCSSPVTTLWAIGHTLTWNLN